MKAKKKAAKKTTARAARASAKPAASVAVGDRVKVTRAGSWAHGRVGEVLRVADNIAHVLIDGKGAGKDFHVSHLVGA